MTLPNSRSGRRVASVRGGGTVRARAARSGGGRPAIGDSEQDGSLDVELDRLALAWLAVGDADAAGEAAEGVGDLGGEGGDVVEGEDPEKSGGVMRFTGETLRRLTRRRRGKRDGVRASLGWTSRRLIPPGTTKNQRVAGRFPEKTYWGGRLPDRAHPTVEHRDPEDV
jgi:hypothetical protein